MEPYNEPDGYGCLVPNVGPSIRGKSSILALNLVFGFLEEIDISYHSSETNILTIFPSIACTLVREDERCLTAIAKNVTLSQATFPLVSSKESVNRSWTYRVSCFVYSCRSGTVAVEQWIIVRWIVQSRLLLIDVSFDYRGGYLGHPTILWAPFS